MRRPWLFSLLVPLAAAALVPLGWHRAAEDRATRIERTRGDLSRIRQTVEEQAHLKLAAGDADGWRYRYPQRIPPSWFPEGLPRHHLEPTRPWMDLAPVGDLAEHPPDPVLFSDDQAGLWFNPNLNLVRARTQLASGPEMLSTYNRLNGTSLAALPRDADPARTPQALPPGEDPLRPAPVPVSTPPEREPAAEPQPLQLRSVPVQVRDSRGNPVTLYITEAVPAEEATDRSDAVRLPSRRRRQARPGGE